LAGHLAVAPTIVKAPLANLDVSIFPKDVRLTVHQEAEVPTTGYSGKTLTQKLGVKPGDVIWAIDAPEHYETRLHPLPDGARIVTAAIHPPIVHAFARTLQALAALTPALVSAPGPGGSIWISWPKKSSAMFVDLTEDGIRRIMLPTGWVDVKVCAVDADWSGLKFLRRRVSPPRVDG